MKKYFFFDLDGTLTMSREEISSQMLALLTTMRRMGLFVIVISGAEKERIQKQLKYFEVDCILAQSGADFFKVNISERDEVEVLRHIKKIQEHFDSADWKSNDLIQNRGSQISFSLTGHNADLSYKRSFDPTGYRRNKILKNIPFFSNRLEATVAGTTCIDYTLKEYSKGKSIAKLIQQHGWNRDECIFYGDKLMAGGNDASVVGIIEAVEVDGPGHLMQLLTKI